MGSKSSKSKRPTSAKTGTDTVAVPTIPQEIIDEILDNLSADSDLRSLQSCALVSKSWVPSCRRHLFHTILFTSTDMAKWLETFLVPEESPAHQVRDLRFSIGKYDSPREKFFEYAPWFTNVERITLLGYGCLQPLWMSSFRWLSQSVNSLTIGADMIAIVQIQDIMARLPNLDNLSLSGSLVAVDMNPLIGTCPVLKGRFGGKLRLLRGHASAGIVDTLLEIPTGLHFTEVEIRSAHECLLSTVRLVEAYTKTLVKLSYTVS